MEHVYRIIVSMFGHLPCPRENGLYERTRLRTNQCLKGELASLKEVENIEVQFIDVDKCLNLDCFGKDGVHFNRSGNTILRKSIVEVMVSLTRLKKEWRYTIFDLGKRRGLGGLIKDS